MSGSSAAITLWVTRSRVGAAVRILAGALALLAPAAGASAGTTERVSVDSGGNEANGESPFRPAISADGRFVAFRSRATNLVAGDTNGSIDVFVHDRWTGATERVSVDSDGNQATGDRYSPAVADCYNPAISADGRFVAFASLAANLVPGDTNGSMDVFVHDRQTGTTERVSVDSAGTEMSYSDHPAISANGSFVAFNSAATDLVPGDTNNLIDVFVHDRRRAAADTAPPPQTNGPPSGTQPAGTTHATITSRTTP